MLQTSGVPRPRRVQCRELLFCRRVVEADEVRRLTTCAWVVPVAVCCGLGRRRGRRFRGRTGCWRCSRGRVAGSCWWRRMVRVSAGFVGRGSAGARRSQQWRVAVRPRWSPDGRALVFAGPRIRIVYPDGSCMNCQFGAASNPAFAPSGTVISFIGRGHVTVDGIDGLRESSPPPGAAVDAVWSASGGLAVVRGGVVWAGRPGLLRRIGAGVQPSWSPDGRLIAAVRRGWVVVMRVGDRRVRRVVRGSAPAFSPDGRWIAFVAGDHRLMIIPAQGRHPAPRPVGKIRAVSVDWQPLPGGANPGCAPPPGSKILASSLDAVLTRRASAPASYGPASAVMGCLRADGRERLLERIPRGNVDYASSIGSGVLAAPYAGLAVDWQDEHYGGFGANVQVFDLRTGLLQNKLGGESISCDYDNCPPVSLDHLALGSDGVSAAHFQTLEPAGSLSTPLEQVSCAAARTVCVAVDVIGSGVLTTSNPTGGPTAWTSATLDSGPHAMTCPSPSLCVGHNWGSIFTSTDPTGGANAWKSTALPTTVVNLDCPSTTLCVASGNSGVFVDNNGRVAVSTDPSGGAGAWSISTIAGAISLVPSSARRCLSASSARAGPRGRRCSRQPIQPQARVRGRRAPVSPGSCRGRARPRPSASLSPRARF